MRIRLIQHCQPGTQADRALGRPSSGCTGRARRRGAPVCLAAVGGGWPSGFSLIELLVVLAIIGVMAGLSLPAIRSISKSRGLDAAGQQLVDDLALARARAINGRTTVHMVFVPPAIDKMSFGSAEAKRAANDLLDGVYRSYGFFVERAAGDQPGRPYYRYVEGWRTLPEGALISTNEFAPIGATAQWNTLAPSNRPLETIQLPFPTRDAVTNLVPHLAFGPEGSLIDSYGNRLYSDEIIYVAEGSILTKRDASGALLYYDVREVGAGRTLTIRIDGFTGRARMERPQIQ